MKLLRDDETEGGNRTPDENDTMVTPREMEAREMDRLSKSAGERREEYIEYFQGLISGRYGATTQSGRDYARRCLDALAA